MSPDSDLILRPESAIDLFGCAHCGREHRVVTSWIVARGVPLAVSKAALFDHEGVPEAWLDVTLGTWGPEPGDDHVTFGTHVDGRTDPPATQLVDAVQLYDHDPLFGQVLTAEQAEQHPWLEEQWEVVDFLLLHEPTISEHVYGLAPDGP